MSQQEASIADLRSSVLAAFKCPHENENPNNIKSRLRARPAAFPHQAATCPFGHTETVGRYVHLRPIPAYLCKDFLSDHCSQVTHSLTDKLVRCALGFHPVSFEDLVDLKSYAEDICLKMLELTKDTKRTKKAPAKDVPEGRKRALLSIDPNVPSTSTEPANFNEECTICYDAIPQSEGIGMLENCSHIFCASCLLEWIKKCPAKNCPMCRVASKKIIIWPTLLKTQDEKTRVFNAQEQCVRLYDSLKPATQAEANRQRQAIYQFYAARAFGQQARATEVLQLVRNNDPTLPH